MTAFDQAFALLKMPLVPGSLEEVPTMNIHGYPIPVGRGDQRFRNYEALFDDPVSNERLKMTATQNPGDVVLEIANTPDDDHYGRGMTTHRSSGKERAGGIALNAFTDQPNIGGSRIAEGVSDSPIYAMEGVGVEDKYQRRGYATALYDLLAHILSNQGLGPVIPSGERSDDAKALWGDREEWPVRDDL